MFPSTLESLKTTHPHPTKKSNRFCFRQGGGGRANIKSYARAQIYTNGNASTRCPQSLLKATCMCIPLRVVRKLEVLYNTAVIPYICVYHRGVITLTHPSRTNFSNRILSTKRGQRQKFQRCAFYVRKGFDEISPKSYHVFAVCVLSSSWRKSTATKSSHWGV